MEKYGRKIEIERGLADDGARIFSGVVIEELYGPADDIYAIGKAGALSGDVIKKVNDININSSSNIWYIK